MAPSIGLSPCKCVGNSFLILPFFMQLYMRLFQRLSCLPCVSYSALASPKSVLAFQSLSCLPYVSCSFPVSAMYLPLTLIHSTASSNAGFSFQSKGMTTLTNYLLACITSAYQYLVPCSTLYLQQAAKGFKIKLKSLSSSSLSNNAKLFIT